MTETAETDFLVANLGSMFGVTPISANANKAVDAGLIDYDDWQLWGTTIMVDPRYAGDLVEHLREDGFVVAEE